MALHLPKDTLLHSNNTALHLHNNTDTRARNHPSTTTTANLRRRLNSMDTIRARHHHNSTATMDRHLRNNHNSLLVQA